MGHVTRIVIIGGGPGGYEAALVAARLGARVTVVDRDGVGGAAVLTDCVPSKTLIATADVMTTIQDAPELGVDGGTVTRVDLARVNERVLALAAKQSEDITADLVKAGVEIVRGFARLAADGAGTVAVEVAAPNGEDLLLEADAVLLATGARPREMASAQPDGERILTWTQLYRLEELPAELIVVGWASPAPSSPAPTRRSVPRSPWSPRATGCCPARTRTPRACSKRSSSAAACACSAVPAPPPPCARATASWSPSRTAAPSPARTC